MKYWFPNVGLRLLGQRPIPNDKNKPNCEATILTYFRFGTKKGSNLKYQIPSHHSPQLMEYNELALDAVLHFLLITFKANSLYQSQGGEGQHHGENRLELERKYFDKSV